MKVVFKYLIEGNIGLNKRQAFRVNFNGMDTIINSETIEGLKAISFHDDFEWLNSDSVEIMDISHRNDIEEVQTRSFYIYRDKSFFEAGVTEGYRLSFVSIVADCESEDELDDVEKFKALSQRVYSVLEYFLNTYKVLTDNISISVPDIDKIIGLEVFVVKSPYELKPIEDRKVEVDTDYSRNVKISDVEMVLSSKFANAYVKMPYENGYLVPTPNKAVMEKLIEMLQGGIKPEAFNVLLMNAKEELVAKSNYLVSSILSETAVEICIQSQLVKMCELRSISMLPCGGNNAEKDYFEAIVNGNIKESLLKKYLRGIFGIDVLGTREYNDWTSNTYNLRNKVVHKGYTSVTKEEAELSFNSSLHFINFVLKKIDVDRHTTA